ncbi:MAG: hypothetical protein BVN35_06135 [Proteobacteria bacterium ST_bin11]|nr:MAG: hypothetical protein BVN35_06135 [Proteobacteria bacterium ST_bin11]
MAAHDPIINDEEEKEERACAASSSSFSEAEDVSTSPSLESHVAKIPWRTQTWRPPLLNLNTTVTSCYYCGQPDPKVRCTDCTTLFCDGVCQEKAESTHRYLCKEGSLQKLVQKLTSIDSLNVSVTLACSIMELVEMVLKKTRRSRVSKEDSFANLYDSLRSSSVLFKQEEPIKCTVKGVTAEIYGNIRVRDHSDGEYDLCYDIANFENSKQFSERSMLFFSLLAFLFNDEHQFISGEMMAMHTAMYQEIFCTQNESKSLIVGISPSRRLDEKDYSVIKLIDTPFNGEELIDPNKNACCVYLFNINAAPSSAIQFNQSHALSLFEYKGDYCIVQAYEDLYTYAQWCDWDNDLETLDSPSHEEVTPFTVSPRPKYRRVSFTYSDVLQLLEDITALTTESPHLKQIYENITGVRLPDDQQPTAFTVTCARFDFLCTTML